MGQDTGQGLGFAKKVALHPAAAHGCQEVRLFLCFHPFHQGLDSQILGHGNDGSNDAPGFYCKVPEKAHVQFDQIHLVILQHIQGRIAAAKVVQPDFISLFPQLVQCLMDHLGVLGQGAFRDFHMEKITGQAVLFPGVFHHTEHIHAVKIVSGQVEGNRGNAQIFVQPFPQHPAHFLQHIGVQPVDQPGLFQHRDEGGRGQEPHLRIHPPGQGFQTAQFACQGADHRLVVHLDPVVLQGLLQVLSHIVPDVPVHRLAGGDVDFLERAEKHLAPGFRIYRPARNIRIADPVFPGEQMALDMGKTAVLFGQFAHDFLEAPFPVFRSKYIETIIVDVPAKLLQVPAVEQPQGLSVGIKQRKRLLRLYHIKTAGKILEAIRERSLERRTIRRFHGQSPCR